MSTGIVPRVFKTSHIIPLLKKPNLDRNELKNYRPIANLMFLAKVMERIVSNQLRVHLEENGLFPEAQSAHRRFHSTETALLKVYNDLLLAVDQGQEAVLVMLDYSAAFDTINHCTLIERLCHSFGIGGTALKWFMSYLEHREQRVVINDTISNAFPLSFGVPQHSCM